MAYAERVLIEDELLYAADGAVTPYEGDLLENAAAVIKQMRADNERLRYWLEASEQERRKTAALLRAMQEAATNSYDMPIGAWQHAINEALDEGKPAWHTLNDVTAS